MFLHHNFSVNEILNEESTDDEDDDTLMTTVENQCHLCREQLKSKDDLFNHVQSQHEVYFLGIMELTNKSTKHRH